MSQTNPNNMALWVKAWKRAGPALEAIRMKELPGTDTVRALEILSPAFRWALESYIPPKSSGLVEQQALFSRIARPKK